MSCGRVACHTATGLPTGRSGISFSMHQGSRTASRAPTPSPGSERSSLGSDRADQVRARIASLVGLTDEPVSGEEIPWAVRRFFEALAAQAAPGPPRRRPPVGGTGVTRRPGAPPHPRSGSDPPRHGRPSGARGGPLRTGSPDPVQAWFASTLWMRPTRPSCSTTSRPRCLRVHCERGSSRPARATHCSSSSSWLTWPIKPAPMSIGSTIGPRSALPIPPTISILLGARLDQLPEADRRVLECAAVVGRTFSAGALAELLPDRELEGLPGRLAQLSRRDLIRPDRSDVPDDQAYRFRHLLIRDAAYEAVPKRERAELHERFANWLEGRAVGDPGACGLIVGYHLEQAYRYRVELSDGVPAAMRLAERALAYIAPAAQTALERGDAHAAVSLLRRAVDLCPPGRRRTELLIDLRSALRTTGDRSASDAVEAEILAFLAPLVGRGFAASSPADRGAVRPGRDDRRSPQRICVLRAGRGRHGHDPSPGGCLQRQCGTRQEHQAAIEILDEATDLALKIGRPDRAASFSSRSAWILPDEPDPHPPGDRTVSSQPRDGRR